MAAAISQIPDPTNLGSGPTRLVNVGIAFLSIAWLAVVLRVWARAIIIRTFGWDDWTILLTMVAFTCQCGYLISVGLTEMHPAKIATLPAISKLVTDIIAFTGSYVLTTIFLKFSLALFFLRIVVESWQRNVIIYSLVVYTMFAFAYFAVTSFGCGDPAKYLERTAQNKCISVVDVVIPMSYAQTSANALMDWIYVVLPILALWNLRMPRSTKTWASALILLGALGSIASLIRIKTVEGLVPGHDFFRTSTSTMTWATIEPGLGIAAVSFATLRPMFKSCIESTRTGYSSHRGGSDRHQNQPPDIKGDAAAGKGLSLSGRTPAERAGFNPFSSADSDLELSAVSTVRDAEKAGGLEGRGRFERNPQGIWVQRAAAVHS